MSITDNSTIAQKINDSPIIKRELGLQPGYWALERLFRRENRWKNASQVLAFLRRNVKIARIKGFFGKEKER